MVPGRAIFPGGKLETPREIYIIISIPLIGIPILGLPLNESPLRCMKPMDAGTQERNRIVLVYTGWYGRSLTTVRA